MKKLVIIFLTLTMYGCVSLSIGNRSIANEENKNAMNCDSFVARRVNGYKRM